ncbi:MAG: DUF433 domain-containing protein [Planctomycetota bacterium]
MEIVLQAESPPLSRDTSGAFRIGETRVLLELVIRAFQDGSTPEAITQRYSSLKLSDVYAVIAYYLRHKEDMECYLNEREKKAEEVRSRILNQQKDLSDLRQRLLAKQEKK